MNGTNMNMSATHAFYNNLRDIVDNGKEIDVRGNKTKELLSRTIKIVDPLRRCYVLPHRNDNIFGKIAETLWMIKGRHDIGWLKYYLPRAPEFSDDGKTWRGAYGPRLRNWNGHTNKVDQIKNVVELIKEDKFTRRAVMSMWDPSEDIVDSKDIPCNNWVHFFVRDFPAGIWDNGRYASSEMVDALYMNVTQRSCDILWGYSGIDTFAWSVLHQMMAYWTGCKVGEFSHFISSLHLYERHYKRAEKILDARIMKTLYQYGYKTPEFSTSIHDIDKKLRQVFVMENMVRIGHIKDVKVKAIKDDFLRVCFQMLQLYIMDNKYDDVNMTKSYLFELPDCDFKVAAIAYYIRKYPDLATSIEMSREDEAMYNKLCV